MILQADDRSGPPRTPPALSVIVVIGAQRRRADECLRALDAQTVADRVEVIVVDTRPEEGQIDSDGASLTNERWAAQRRVQQGIGLSYGEARAAAVRGARAEIVAFVEDHCRPEPAWAEALLNAYADFPAAVGYSIGIANPSSLVSRIAHLANYGEWDAPGGGVVTALPGNNVSYRRDVLTACGEQLADLLTVDFNLHQRMLAQGLKMVVEPAARVLHESEELYRSVLAVSFVYGRLLAAKRASLERWSLRSRLEFAAKDLLGSPAARLQRLAALAGDVRGRLRLALLSPAIGLLFIAGSVGEACGYLLGEGNSGRWLLYFEVDAPRTTPSVWPAPADVPSA